MLSLSQTDRILDKVMSFSQAEAISVSLYSNDSFDLRFAVNTVTTCGSASGITLYINSYFGQRAATVSTTAVDDISIETAVRRSEELARLAPENPETMPPLEAPQHYLTIDSFDEATAAATPQSCSDALEECLRLSRSQKIDLAGFLAIWSGSACFGNSRGLRTHHRSTEASFSTSARTREGRGSHKVQLSATKFADIQLHTLADRAIQRAFESGNPVELPPGRYPAILEPSACADMLGFFVMHMSKRRADEGRNFFSEPGGMTKEGQKLFADAVTFDSNPQDARAPGSPWGEDGTPVKPTTWIERGRLCNLPVERYWANKTNSAVLPMPANILVHGGTKSLSDLIASTDRAILVTNLWYIRDLDPQKLLLTGLTRDGLFLVEEGKIKCAVKNFRFNESPAEMLKNVLDMSTATRTVGNEIEHLKCVVPALKLSSFNFSTLSDAI